VIPGLDVWLCDRHLSPLIRIRKDRTESKYGGSKLGKPSLKWFGPWLAGEESLSDDQVSVDLDPGRPRLHGRIVEDAEINAS
jgi:hypothetical protein